MLEGNVLAAGEIDDDTLYIARWSDKATSSHCLSAVVVLLVKKEFRS